MGLSGRFGSHKFKCLSIFRVTSGSSINATNRIFPRHLGQIRGSTSYIRNIGSSVPPCSEHG